jgi:hypothetical protein
LFDYILGLSGRLRAQCRTLSHNCGGGAFGANRFSYGFRFGASEKKVLRPSALIAHQALGLSDLKTASLKSAKRRRIINPTRLQINSKDEKKNTLK